jgi:S-adenosylmethionine-diacylglycerol 3-amino-3-carboxypropyl transferase
MSSLKEEVDFSLIRYANCWEDAEVLLSSLDLSPGTNCLIIASGGDNALALLSTSPASVRAIDLSTAQLYLCELKQTAIARLEWDELLVLLGVCGSSEARWTLYSCLRGALSNNARGYWDARRALIETGIMHMGKFEHYFQLFRRWLLPLVHGKKSIQELLTYKSDSDQDTYFRNNWDTWRWRALMGIFFSRAVMGRYGRDPQFLKHVSLNVQDYIRSKAEAHLRTSAATSNPFLHYIFTGTFGPILPVYLQEAHFTTIKQNIARLHLAEEDMDAAVHAQQYDVYCASNIFEYMSADTFDALANRWTPMIPAGARIAFWNLMAPRSFAETLPQSWDNCAVDIPTDNGFFYSRYLLECRK